MDQSGRRMNGRRDGVKRLDGVDFCRRSGCVAGTGECATLVNCGADRRFRRTRATNGRARGIVKLNYAAYNWVWDVRAHAYVWAYGRKTCNRKMHALHGNMPGGCAGCRQMPSEQQTLAYVVRRGNCFGWFPNAGELVWVQVVGGLALVPSAVFVRGCADCVHCAVDVVVGLALGGAARGEPLRNGAWIRVERCGVVLVDVV